MSKAIRRLIRRKEVTRVTGTSASTQDRLEAKEEFPKRVQLSENSVAWYEDEIAEWNENRPRGGVKAPAEANAARRKSEPEASIHTAGLIRGHGNDHQQYS